MGTRGAAIAHMCFDPASGAPLFVGVVGIDGCGKSSVVAGALRHLATDARTAAIGDVVATAGPAQPPRERSDIPLSRSARAIGAAAKGLRRPDLYKNLKLLEFIERTHIRRYLQDHDAPAVILGDGDPLVNVSSWAAARYLREELGGSDGRLADLVSFMSGDRRIPARQLPYWIRAAWQLALANRLHLSRFPLPDLVVLLEISPATSLERIRARGRPLQAHETEAFLSQLAESYERVCTLLETRFCVSVVRVPVDDLGPEQTIEAVVQAVRRRLGRPGSLEPVRPDSIEVIATTMSGSFADQRNVGRIEGSFRSATDQPVRVHAVDSHEEATRVTQEIVRQGGRIIVSAGGAGTMNAVLEGCHIDGAVPPDLRLAFLRKGSADLIGKALHVPDDLPQAAAALADSIAAERTVAADILAAEAIESDGRVQRRHVLGFGGIGVFGDVPRFTESRFVKYYKGLLGTVLGDLGPFYVGLGLATVAWTLRGVLGRLPAIQLDLDGDPLPVRRWQSVIWLNGDLGRDFPLGRGLPFSSGTLRVVVLHHRSVRAMWRQVAGSRRGSLLAAPEKYDAMVREVQSLVARPVGRRRRFMVNLDGLQMLTSGTVRVTISGRVQLFDAAGNETMTDLDARAA